MNRELDRELLWRQYQLHVDMYKHYLEITLKFNAFYYAITGSIVSFYFSRADLPLMVWSLTLPIIMSLTFGGFFLWGARHVTAVHDEVNQIVHTLGLTAPPAIRVLAVALRMFGVLSVLVGIGLLSLLIIKAC